VTAAGKLPKITIEKVPGLTYEPKRHRYAIDGLWVPGVTTILGILDKPALKQWAADMACEHIRSVWRPDVSSSAAEIESHLIAARTAHCRRAQAAKDAGSAAHLWLQGHVYGVRLPTPIEIRDGLKPGSALPPALKDAGFDSLDLEGRPDEWWEAFASSVNAFLTWEHSHEIEYLEVELSIGDLVNGYAGTMDFLAWVDRELTLGDFKTSKGVYPEFWLQLAAYAHAVIERMVGGLPVERKKLKRLVLQIPKDGGGCNPVAAPADQTQDEDFAAFLAAKTGWEWNRKHGGGR